MLPVTHEPEPVTGSRGVTRPDRAESGIAVRESPYRTRGPELRFRSVQTIAIRAGTDRSACASMASKSPGLRGSRSCTRSTVRRVHAPGRDAQRPDRWFHRDRWPGRTARTRRSHRRRAARRSVSNPPLDTHVDRSVRIRTGRRRSARSRRRERALVAHQHIAVGEVGSSELGEGPVEINDVTESIHNLGPTGRGVAQVLRSSEPGCRLRKGGLGMEERAGAPLGLGHTQRGAGPGSAVHVDVPCLRVGLDLPLGVSTLAMYTVRPRSL